MLAVDLDGVLIDSEKMLVAGLEEYTGQTFKSPTPRTYDFRDGFDNLSLRECLSVIDNTIVTQKEFIYPYDFIDMYMSLAILQKYEKYVTFLTSRNEDKTTEATKEWLYYYFGLISYNLHFTDHKITWMFKNDCLNIVEDRLKTANEIAENPYYTVYLVNREWNIGRKTHNSIVRVDSLLDAVELYTGEKFDV